MKKIYYTVYKTTNLINGKVYIGCHKTDNLEDDYLGSGKILKYAIEKYGSENFKKEVLKVFDNPEDMFEMESILVNEEFIKDDSNYNLKLGGTGGWDHNNSIEGQKLRAEKYHLWYTAGTNAFVKKLKEDEEFKKEWLKYFQTKGVEKVKELYPNGTFYGKSHSDESKKIMSEKAKERLKDPTKNSQYGTMWIHSIELKKSKKINKNSPIPKGWEKGRKIKF